MKYIKHVPRPQDILIWVAVLGALFALAFFSGILSF